MIQTVYKSWNENQSAVNQEGSQNWAPLPSLLYSPVWDCDIAPLPLWSPGEPCSLWITSTVYKK